MDKIAFLDRDGTLIYEPGETKQVDSLEKLKILPGVITGLKKLQQLDHQLIMVTNQDGLGTVSFPQKKFNLIQEKLLADFKKNGIEFAQILICPHWSKDNCSCRKPKPGMIEKAVKDLGIDLSKSWLVGDSERDIQVGREMNLKTILLGKDAKDLKEAVKIILS